MGRIRRWVPRREKQTVEDPHQRHLARAIHRLQRAGYTKFQIDKDRTSDKWWIEAIRFEMEEE